MVCFQFLGIPPKGERDAQEISLAEALEGFQFLGIPPKGEQHEGKIIALPGYKSFQFLGIPPKGERKLFEVTRGVTEVSNF